MMKCGWIVLSASSSLRLPWHLRMFQWKPNEGPTLQMNQWRQIIRPLCKILNIRGNVMCVWQYSFSFSMNWMFFIWSSSPNISLWPAIEQIPNLILSVRIILRSQKISDLNGENTWFTAAIEFIFFCAFFFLDLTMWKD